MSEQPPRESVKAPIKKSLISRISAFEHRNSAPSPSLDFFPSMQSKLVPKRTSVQSIISGGGDAMLDRPISNSKGKCLVLEKATITPKFDGSDSSRSSFEEAKAETITAKQDPLAESDNSITTEETTTSSDTGTVTEAEESIEIQQHSPPVVSFRKHPNAKLDRRSSSRSLMSEEGNAIPSLFLACAIVKPSISTRRRSSSVGDNSATPVGDDERKSAPGANSSSATSMRRNSLATSVRSNSSLSLASVEEDNEAKPAEMITSGCALAGKTKWRVPKPSVGGRSASERNFVIEEIEEEDTRPSKSNRSRLRHRSASMPEEDTKLEPTTAPKPFTQMALGKDQARVPLQINVGQVSPTVADLEQDVALEHASLSMASDGTETRLKKSAATASRGPSEFNDSEEQSNERTKATSSKRVAAAVGKLKTSEPAPIAPDTTIISTIKKKKADRSLSPCPTASSIRSPVNSDSLSLPPTPPPDHKIGKDVLENLISNFSLEEDKRKGKGPDGTIDAADKSSPTAPTHTIGNDVLKKLIQTHESPQSTNKAGRGNADNTGIYSPPKPLQLIGKDVLQELIQGHEKRKERRTSAYSNGGGELKSSDCAIRTEATKEIIQSFNTRSSMMPTSETYKPSWLMEDTVESAKPLQKAGKKIYKQPDIATQTNAEAVENAPKARERPSNPDPSIDAKKHNKNICAGPLTIDLSNFKPPSFYKVDPQTSLIRDTIKDNFVLQGLAKRENEAPELFVQAVEPVQAAPGEVIVREGEAGKHMFLIEEGRVDFQVDGVTVGYGTAGSTFGEMNLLYSGPESASAIASSDGDELTKLLRIDQETFRGIMESTQEESPTQKNESTTLVDASRGWWDDSAILQKRAATQRYIRSNVGLDDLERISVLGEGQFGEVWLVSVNIPSSGTEKFALKIQAKTDDTREEMTLKAIHTEMEIMHTLKHPFIVDLVHTYDEDPQSSYMLLGLVSGGELWDQIYSQDDDGQWSYGIPEDHAKFYGLIVADTLSYIHGRNYIFRDLKPENVLIDGDGYPLIADFGFAKHTTEKSFTLCGTPHYMAPEYITLAGHDKGADNWALGVLIYEMLSGENPFFFEGMDDREVFVAAVEEEYHPLSEETSASARSLVGGLLEKDPDARLGSKTGEGRGILEHEWFDGMDLDRLRSKSVKAPWVPNEGNDSANLEVALDSEGTTSDMVVEGWDLFTTSEDSGQHEESLVNEDIDSLVQPHNPFFKSMGDFQVNNTRKSYLSGHHLVDPNIVDKDQVIKKNQRRTAVKDSLSTCLLEEDEVLQ